MARWSPTVLPQPVDPFATILSSGYEGFKQARDADRARLIEEGTLARQGVYLPGMDLPGAQSGELQPAGLPDVSGLPPISPFPAQQSPDGGLPAPSVLASSLPMQRPAQPPAPAGAWTPDRGFGTPTEWGFGQRVAPQRFLTTMRGVRVENPDYTRFQAEEADLRKLGVQDAMSARREQEREKRDQATALRPRVVRDGVLNLETGMIEDVVDVGGGRIERRPVRRASRAEIEKASYIPAESVIAIPQRDGTIKYVPRSEAPGYEGYRNPLMNVRGFGQGGPFGAASGLGSVNEMEVTIPAMEEIEQRMGPGGQIPNTGWDQFRRMLIEGGKANAGFLDRATAAAAVANLATVNPELADYGALVANWVVADLNLTRGSTDERGRQDIISSSVLLMPTGNMSREAWQRHIGILARNRRARFEGLARARPGVEAMLENLGRMGNRGATPPAPPAPASPVAQWKAANPKQRGETEQAYYQRYLQSVAGTP